MMPGSTVSPTTEPAKAKVTSETNGIFVRPVAVAGIFCPTNEGTAKPPALPEKRRFSTLVGDLRPVASGDSSGVDDFARRRQSWDSRQKEVPFGQALLRKTPRNTNPPPSRTAKSDDFRNGTSTADNSPRVTDGENLPQITQVKPSETVKSPEQPPKSDSREPSYKISAVNNSLKTEQDNFSDRPEGVLTCKQNESSVVTSSGKELKTVLGDVRKDAVLQTSRDANKNKLCKTTVSNNDKTVCAEIVNDPISISTDTTKQTKKIYGLMKREPKLDIISVKNDNTPENAPDISSTLKSVATKNKVYGLSKANIKKDSGNEVVEYETKKVNTSLETKTAASVKSGDVFEKTSESKAAPEPFKIGNENKRFDSPPKDVRTVRRTSGNIAAKIQNMFANFQPEKTTPVLPKKTKVPDKISSHVTRVSVNSDENKKEEKGGALSSVINVSSKTKVPCISDEKTLSSEAKSTLTTNAQNVKSTNGSKENDNVSLVLTNVGGSSLKNNDSSNSNCACEIPNPQSFKPEPPCTKESKSKPSINAASSKQLHKKGDIIEGRVPIKNEELGSSDGTKTFLIATNQETDRKSPVLTTTSSSEMQDVNISTGAKTLASLSNNKTSEITGERNLKATFSSQSLNNSIKEVQNIDVKNSKKSDLVKKSFDGKLSQKSTTIKTTVSQSVTTASAVEVTKSTSCKTTFSSESCTTGVQKSNEITKSLVNGSAEPSEVSKLEITKLTPSTQPGIVPTVNVLFRTKSPQATLNKDENRKKVLIETSSNSASIPSTLLISPKPLSTATLPNAAQSVNDTLKVVESVQQSLNSPKVLKKHPIVNLQHQEVATVDLSSNKQSPLDAGGKTESEISCNADQKKSPITEISISADKSLKTLPQEHSSTGLLKCKTQVSHADSIVSTSTAEMDITNVNKAYSTCTSASVQDKLSVVDLNDWNKKFQRIEPEAPRAPLRRRAFRDSLPPSLPLRTMSRFGSGSLKRIEDSTRYIPRSPSQSSLPQRYSYTEMLSKVCSMGVLPFVEPNMSKSCSSSSSQVSELWSELSEEQSTATHASEMLEAETTERMRLEKEVHELQNRYSQVQQRSDKMEMEIMESRVYRSSELNGDLSEDEDPDGSGSIYKQKYERAVRDMEMMKRRFQQQHEEEMEQKAILKKASDKRLAEALEDVDEERQVANQWKRKAQKCGAELQDLRLMLEEQMARNGELEKKQRRFDAELSAAQEEIKKEKLLREKLMREKDQIVHEKYSLEQDLQAVKLDSDMLHEKISQLNRELDELTLSSKGEEEVTQLKRAKQELERKSRDQEEELEEMAAQAQMLEQAKLRLEMSLEKLRQEHRREASVREEEIEEIRASFSKKIKNLEAQLESEQDERHQLVKQKHELERRLYEIVDQPPPHDPEIERRLRRDLKRTKALLRDAQSMLEHTREGQSSKTLIRQLKNQLEDSEFAKATAIKARQAIETELQDCQLQLEEITRTKNEAETRCLQLSREKSGVQTQLEEAEEEMAEVMKKYKAVVAQMSADQKILGEQNQQIAELETERQMLKEQLSEVSHKFEHLAGQSDDAHKVHWLDSKIRDLESKLELEQTTKARLEHQISRLKEQNDRAREECDSLRNKELQAQEAVRRLQRQIRDSREDYSALQQKEADGYRKQHELEMALENTETDLQVTKNDLRLACQRIQDLQNALEDDLDSGTDVPDDSGSDSDSSFELSVLRNSSLTPIQRCESIASNLSYDTEGPRSRTASFTQELSAFSRMMLRKSSMDFLG